MSTTIHCQDALAAAVADVRVNVWKQDGVTLLATGLTNGSGDFVFTTPANGFYYLEARKSRTAFPANQYVQVTGDGQTKTISGVVETFTDPSPALTCHLWGMVFDARGKGVKTTIIVETLPSMTASGGTTSTLAHLTGSVIGGKSEILSDQNNGLWEIDLIQGSFVRIYIPDMGFEKTFQVPESLVANIIDVLPASGVPSTNRTDTVF